MIKQERGDSKPHLSNEMRYHVPFTSDSSLADGLHVSAALGGGAPHAFLVDTGSVGILVPRQVLGPDYQDFDPSPDITFGYVSSGNTYQGQWVKRTRRAGRVGRRVRLPGGLY